MQFSFLLHYHVGPEFIQRWNHWPILITEHFSLHGHFWALRNLVTLLTKYHHMVLFVSMIGIEKPLRICAVTLAQNAYITLKMLTLNLNTNDYMAWKFWLLYAYTWPFANSQGSLQMVIHCKHAWISDHISESNVNFTQRSFILNGLVLQIFTSCPHNGSVCAVQIVFHMLIQVPKPLCPDSLPPNDL